MYIELTVNVEGYSNLNNYSCILYLYLVLHNLLLNDIK